MASIRELIDMHGVPLSIVSNNKRYRMTVVEDKGAYVVAKFPSGNTGNVQSNFQTCNDYEVELEKPS